MQNRQAVLLMAYGGPDSLDEVEPYLLDVRGGRPTSPQLIEEIRGRYAEIGGCSPLLRHTTEQAAALERALSNGSAEFRTYVGMRHWRPRIGDVFDEIVADGFTHVLAMAMAPHYSRMSVGAYERKVQEAGARHPEVKVRLVGGWHDHPLFLDAVAEKVRRSWRGEAVVFTAHSLPQRIVADGDPYAEEFVSSAAAVARLVGLADWQWAYQSEGSSSEKWLGPSLAARLEELRARSIRDVLVVPIGFVCDHVEVLYDIDIECRKRAADRGMRLRRTESLNASPAFIRALAAIVGEAVA